MLNCLHVKLTLKRIFGEFHSTERIQATVFTQSLRIAVIGQTSRKYLLGVKSTHYGPEIFCVFGSCR